MCFTMNSYKLMNLLILVNILPGMKENNFSLQLHMRWTWQNKSVQRMQLMTVEVEDGSHSVMGGNSER